MRWPFHTARRAAEREERESLRRYASLRGTRLSPVWTETVMEARRFAEAELRLEERLRSMR
jgi:hypothetical protein